MLGVEFGLLGARHFLLLGLDATLVLLEARVHQLDPRFTTCNLLRILRKR